MRKQICNSFIILFFCFLFSCGSPPTIPQVPSDVYEDEGEENYSPPPIVRRLPKYPDPEKQKRCNERGKRNCEGNEDCEDICDDIFTSRSDKKNCYELSEELVSNFEKLIDATENGDIDEVDAGILECLLDIDDRGFARAIKKMSRRESRDFIVAVGEDEYLAEVLEDEDDEFNILKQILNKAVSSNALQTILTKEIDDGKTVLWLFGEGNEYAWKWLDDYVSDECESSPSSCPDGDNIEAYCKALLEMSDRNLEDFLIDADLFAEEYEDDIEDEDFEYEVRVDSGEKGFKEYCQSLVPGPCPTTANASSLPEGKKLAVITLALDGGIRKYALQGHCHDNGHIFTSTIGSSSPNQEILMRLNDWNSDGELVLDDDKIGYSADKTYYLYIDNTRYDLGDIHREYDSSSKCTSPPEDRDLIYWVDFLGGDLTVGDVDVWFASEENGICTYYYDD